MILRSHALEACVSAIPPPRLVYLSVILDSFYLFCWNLNLMSSYYILDGMTIQQIYDLAVEMGMKADPRGMVSVKKYLQKNKKRYEELSEKKKKYFDKE